MNDLEPKGGSLDRSFFVGTTDIVGWADAAVIGIGLTLLGEVPCS